MPNPADITPPGSNMANIAPDDATAIDPMAGAMPAKEPLVGNEMGAMFGNAMKQ